MYQSNIEKVETIIEILQDVLKKSQDYDGYRNEREEEALVSTIQRAIWCASNQLMR